MKDLQAKLREIFEPRRDEYWTELEETNKSRGFEIKGFEDGRGNYFILEAEASEMWRTMNYETMIEFVSEKLGGWNLLNDSV